MADEIHLSYPWYSVRSIQFGFYDPSEVRKASVKEITNTVAFDSNKNAQPDGLYDPALGVSPNDRSTTCVTCGHTGLDCSGHMGHIELLLPVYNPLVIDRLLQVLKAMCFECHRFRIRSSIIKRYILALRLIRKGMLNEAAELDELQTDHLQKQLKRLSNQPEKEGKKDASINEQIKKLKQTIEALNKRKKIIVQEASKTKNVEMTNASITAFIEKCKAFYRQSVTKCPHCLKLHKGVKKEGASKFFMLNQHSHEQRKKSSSTTKGETNIEQSIEEVEEERGKSAQSKQSKEKQKKQTYMNPKQVYNMLKDLWRNQTDILKKIYGNNMGSNTFNMFFLNVITVPPNRFRPESKMGQQRYLHDHTIILTNILTSNKQLKHMLIMETIDPNGNAQSTKKAQYQEKHKMGVIDIKKSNWYKDTLQQISTKHDFINKWLELQDNVNCFLDASKASKMADRQSKGIKQVLEKKQGLFRMKMMGKRVNYAARSVISPDPSLQTDQVGLPIFMAKKLTFPEHVNEYNSERLKQYIINGKEYPGAVYLSENGRLIRLDLLTEEQRISHASSLLVNGHNKVVYRHLMNGDNVLFNRQPTLHKPGLMAHRIRVLPREQTLRMNYANCKSYNADFDGDEMNLHALQNYGAKAEAQLCITDRIYANPTNGKPIRELIQDSIISAVYLTFRDTFLTKEEYSELLYQSTFALFQNRQKNLRLFMMKPTIIKPKRLWTGKQLVSNIMKLIVSLSDQKGDGGLTMKAKTKVPASYLIGEAAKQQAEVLIVNNELLKGIIDKNQIGSNSDYGLVHSFNELYGYKLTGQLMTCLTKLFSSYLQMHGFTCGMDDLMLQKKVDKTRKIKQEEAHEMTVNEVAFHFGVADKLENVDYVGRKTYHCDQSGNVMQESEEKAIITEDTPLCQALLRKVIEGQEMAVVEVDEQFKHHLHEHSSKINDECLKGFIKRFPENNFSMMTITGAKGSNVNHSQVAVMLGQQELEGKRVPMMISKKTLPCFIACDPNPRAYGFISDRFLTGLRQQQFFFHCMAGREGLIDTAVKTSRSGYLQRCLMKHLESLKVQYDYTVRDADSGIIQFYYGQDSIDPTKQKFLERFDFLKDNKKPFQAKYDLNHFKDLLKTKEIEEYKLRFPEPIHDTIMNKFHIGANLGSMSEKSYDHLQEYMDNIIKSKQKLQFQQLFQLKYINSLVQPGQSVGCTAAQAVGEPSTQMTLNTFHLAGHGGVNLTLGIPRLRQILMTSTDKLKTPIMELYFVNEKTITKEQANYYAQQLQKVRLLYLVKEVEVEEHKKLFEKDQLLSQQQRKRIYNVKITFQNLKLIQRQFGIDYDQIQQKIRSQFILMLLDHIEKVQKKSDLRAEIKRNRKVEEDEDDDEQKQVTESKLEEEQTDKDDTNEKYKKVLDSPYFESMEFGKDSCVVEVKVPLSLKKFLMTKVIEKFLKATIMRQTPGINRAIVLTKNDKPYIQTEGVNFRVMEKLSFLDHRKIMSNDIQAVYRSLGIEGARAAIIREILSVFRPYGVEVNHRHLYLIADYLTFPGVVKAMNRTWMQDHVSPFLKMSFETSVGFLTMAACHREVDMCRTPSSQIVLGQPPTLGTGVFDLFMDMKFEN